MLQSGRVDMVYEQMVLDVQQKELFDHFSTLLPYCYEME